MNRPDLFVFGCRLLLGSVGGWFAVSLMPPQILAAEGRAPGSATETISLPVRISYEPNRPEKYSYVPSQNLAAFPDRLLEMWTRRGATGMSDLAPDVQEPTADGSRFLPGADGYFEIHHRRAGVRCLTKPVFKLRMELFYPLATVTLAVKEGETITSLEDFEVRRCEVQPGRMLYELVHSAQGLAINLTAVSPASVPAFGMIAKVTVKNLRPERREVVLVAAAAEGDEKPGEDKGTTSEESTFLKVDCPQQHAQKRPPLMHDTDYDVLLGWEADASRVSNGLGVVTTVTLEPASEAGTHLTCVIDSPGYDQDEMHQRVRRFFDRNPNLPLLIRQRMTEEGVDIMCRIVVDGDKAFERIRTDSARVFEECCRAWDLGVYRDTPVSFDVPDSKLRSLLNLTANDLFPGLVQPPGVCHNTKYGDPWHYIFCYRHVHAASNLGLEPNAIDFLRMLSTNQKPNGWIRSVGRDFQGDGHPTSFDASYIDALYHYYKWTGDLESVRPLWPTVSRAIQFIEASLNPDDDSLYRDLIHQWKSDADSRGPSSSYQTALVRKAYADLSELASALGYPWQAEKYGNRARHIMEAAQKELWSPEMAMLGSKGPLGMLRLHPECLEVEIPIWTGLVDPWQAFALTDWYLHNISFRDERGGLWVKESDWWPLIWSQAMVADGDAVMIAWALLQTGHYDEGCRLLETIAGSGFRSPSPGMSYVVDSRGVYFHGDLGGKDPATAIGALGRAVVEGVFGVEPHLDRKHFVLRPRLAWNWDKASFSRKGLAIHWKRQDERQTLNVKTASDVSSTVRLSVRQPVRDVRVDGAAATFEMHPGIGRGEVEVELPAGGATIDLRCDPSPWKISAPPRLEVGQIAEIRLSDVEAFDIDDRFRFFEVVGRDSNRITVRLKKAACGRATLFLNCRCGNLKWIHPVVFSTLPENAKAITPTTVLDPLPESARVATVDLSEAYTDDIQRCFEHYFYWDHGPQFYLEAHKPEKLIRYWFQPTFKLTRPLPRRIEVGGIPFLLGPMGPGEDLERHNDLLMLANTPPRELPTTARFEVNRRLASVYLLSLNMTVSMKSYVPAVDILVEYEDGERELTQLIAPLNFDTYGQNFGINTVAYPLDDIELHFPRRHAGWTHQFTMTNIICDPDKVAKSIEIRSIATETFFGLAGMTLATVGE